MPMTMDLDKAIEDDREEGFLREGTRTAAGDETWGYEQVHTRAAADQDARGGAFFATHFLAALSRREPRSSCSSKVEGPPFLYTPV